MIKNDQELEAMFERIERFHEIIVNMRRTETNPTIYKLSGGGFLAEVDRMNLEVREYLSLHPSEFKDELELAEA